MEIIVTVDRIEGDLAVLEVGTRLVDWPLSELPAETCEGQRFTLTIAPAPADLSEARARLERLKRRGPKGDEIDL